MVAQVYKRIYREYFPLTKDVQVGFLLVEKRDPAELGRMEAASSRTFYICGISGIEKVRDRQRFTTGIHPLTMADILGSF